MYVELHCHSNFSLLDGASHPEELVAQATALGMPALALTDHDAVYGAPRFIQAARQYGLQPILGAEMTLVNGSHLTLLVENETGWHNLCYLISRARHNAPKGEAALAPEELVGCTGGLIALSGCREGEIAQALRQDDRSAALASARRYRALFGPDNFWLELQRHQRRDDTRLVSRLAALAAYLRLGCVATNNVHYATPDRQPLQDVLVAIRHLTTLDMATQLCRPNSEYYLKDGSQMAALFADQPLAVSNTLLLAERCHFELSYGLQELPQFPTPHGMSSGAYLRRLCLETLPRCYPSPPPSLQTQLDHELATIERADLANYFLIVWDIVRFAQAEGIRCQGRGSAANSLVAYLLGITPIDPLAHDLVFERFLSEERRATPDIDIDFDAGRREEVIQYLYQRYGPEHVAMACTFVTFRRRSALRDVGKALGLSPHQIAAVMATTAQLRDNHEQTTHNSPPLAAPATGASDYLLVDLARQLEGYPRHLGIHSGGMVLTGAPLMSRAPTEPATMTGRTVVQWDKSALEEVGLVKIDVLGLRILAAITETAGLVDNDRFEVAGRRLDDPAVYRMIAQAETIGVFQVESRAQAQMLPRLQPRCFDDLVVAISLIRPGPIQGNMVHPYLRRRLGLEPVVYLHPLLEPALRETLGVILFQEQVLKVARDLAGFTPSQGERLRRALGAKEGAVALEQLRADFLSGAAGRNAPPDVAETIFSQLKAFGGYAFPKSHAAAFAVLVYQSAWLKRYYPAQFYTALLNNQPMGFWTPAVLVNEVKRQGLPVWPVDIERSQAGCTVEAGGIRLGLSYVKGMGAEQIAAVIQSREEGSGDAPGNESKSVPSSAPFTGLRDFCRRTGLNRSLVERLIQAGAMDGWGTPRRQLLWELGVLAREKGTLALDFPIEPVVLPVLSPAEALLAEQQVMGLSAGEHVMSLYADYLAAAGILDSRGLANCRAGERVRVAGLLVVHQAPPTAKGHHFLTLEDSWGMVNVIVRPDLYRRCRQTIHASPLLQVLGVAQRATEAVTVLALRVEPLVG